MTRKLKPKRKPVTFVEWWLAYDCEYPRRGWTRKDFAKAGWEAALREAKRREKARKK